MTSFLVPARPPRAPQPQCRALERQKLEPSPGHQSVMAPKWHLHHLPYLLRPLKTPSRTPASDAVRGPAGAPAISRTSVCSVLACFHPSVSNCVSVICLSLVGVDSLRDSVCIVITCRLQKGRRSKLRHVLCTRPGNITSSSFCNLLKNWGGCRNVISMSGVIMTLFSHAFRCWEHSAHIANKV